MSDEGEQPATGPRASGHDRVWMPIEDRIPPEEWTAEHHGDPDERDGGRSAADAERLRSTPWGYH